MSEKSGYWTVNGTPACQSTLTLGVEYFDPHYDRKMYTVCACDPELFEIMAQAVRDKYPHAVCVYHEGRCDRGMNEDL